MNHKRLLLLFTLAALATTAVVYAQSVITSRGLVVTTLPEVVSVTAVANREVVVGDTFRVFGVAHDSRGNEVTGRRYLFQVLNDTGQPDTTFLRIVSTNDTSALIFAKAVGRSRIVAGLISP